MYHITSKFTSGASSVIPVQDLPKLKSMRSMLCNDLRRPPSHQLSMQKTATLEFSALEFSLIMACLDACARTPKMLELNLPEGSSAEAIGYDLTKQQNDLHALIARLRPVFDDFRPRTVER